MGGQSGLHAYFTSNKTTTYEHNQVHEEWCDWGPGRHRFVGGLSGLHAYFTSNNTTTYEHFRARYSSHGNPYDLGFLRNWHSARARACAFRVQGFAPKKLQTGHGISRAGLVRGLERIYMQVCNVGLCL